MSKMGMVTSITDVGILELDAHRRTLSRAASATRDAEALFLMIGATANTSGLPQTLERDDKGYIRTGRDLIGWSLDRERFPLETSFPAMLCAGEAPAVVARKRIAATSRSVKSYIIGAGWH